MIPITEDLAADIAGNIVALRRLLESDLVTAPTRAALLARLDRRAPAPAFFEASDFALLEAVSARLLPQNFVNLAAEVDARLAAGAGDGWRYDALPPDGEAYRLGLRGLDQSARAQHGQAFTQLGPGLQDALLEAAQRGAVSGEIWSSLPSSRFFEELLTELSELYFSHPLAQQDIGYIGFADAHGWSRVGLNEVDRALAEATRSEP